MDSTQRISKSGRAVYQTSNQTKVNQTREAVVSVSEDRSVSDEQREKVGGVAADRKANLGLYKELLDGKSLPAMTQLMAASKTEEESVARKALEKPDLKEVSATEGGKDVQESGEEDSEKKAGKVSEEKGQNGKELTTEDQTEVQKLKQRDREVRTHEQAHVAAGGQYVRGGIQYEYQRGPDGRNYAVGGHVNIDVSDARTPEATITKMQQVKRAALAPADPSGADRAVAAAAGQKEQQARTEILEQRQEEVKESRAEVAEKGETARDTTSTESTSSGSGEAIELKTEGKAPPEPPKIDAPDRSDHMNLARDARMRIKRGESWMA